MYSQHNDKNHDECGVFGVTDNDKAAALTHLGLYALQHRGQKSAGIVTKDRDTFKLHRGIGLVSEVFNKQDLAALSGRCALGHVRFVKGWEHVTTINAQPLMVNCSKGQIAIAMNGSILNEERLRTDLVNAGAIFQTQTDAEVILHLIAHSTAPTLESAIIDALTQVEGAFAVVFLTDNGLIAARDPHGVKPLCLGKKDNGYVIASESCAFTLIDATIIREVHPGELLIINNNAVHSRNYTRPLQSSFCLFEYIYFSRPDSVIFGQSVYDVRRRTGQQLALESPVDADFIISVPDSGNCAAIGYAQTLNIPFNLGLIRNHYVGRTHLKNSPVAQTVGVRLKLAPIAPFIKGKRVCLVDDSIIRGNTVKKIVRLIKNAGAQEIHMRLASPLYKRNCPYGSDMEYEDDRPLIAANHTADDIKNFLEVDSIGFLSIDGLLTAVNGTKTKDAKAYCTMCFYSQSEYTGEISPEPELFE